MVNVIIPEHDRRMTLFFNICFHCLDLSEYTTSEQE